ncbi:transglutaminaseTgpA domain-containing protein [Cupriavidus sp. 30B13]|uniref:transglutaminase family protein n=1 Tax=Cupriavidus sp. 30B13 TaxID=3384241 RepID=UPI003B909E01
MKPAPRLLAHEEHGLLLGQLALVLAPQARSLPVAVSVLLVLLMGWRWLLWRQRAPLPSRLMLGLTAGLVLLVAAALVWQAGGNMGRDLSVALLGAFVVLKLLECRVLADATLVTQLCFYLLLSLYLFDQPFWLALYSLAIAAWLLRNWLFLGHPEARGYLAVWPLLGRLALVGLPWALLLFVLFPRLDRPLWRLPQAEPVAATGLSDTMSPGSVSELTQSAEVALRADVEGGQLPPGALYWRALVLWRFDGQTWRPAPGRQRRTQAAPELPATDTAAAGAIDYHITLEPNQHPWLFLLDRGQAISVPAGARINADGEFFTRDLVDRRLRYRARSGPAAAEPLDPQTLQLALSLPPGNPRSRALAAEWEQRYADPAQRAQAALRLFAAAPFAYTLSPAPLGHEQVDSFLFDTRRGFCEHYASSFVFLMRAAGVPARVVTGYQGGEYNPIGGNYIVRQADAHAWAEIWLAGRGWVRVDPTSAVAPSRVERGLDAALQASEIAALSAAREPGWLRDLRWGMDGMVYTWQRWVLQYDRGQQTRLMQQLGIGDSLPQALLGGLAALSLLGLVPLVRRRREADPVQALYARFCRELARHGCVRAPAEGPRDFAARAARAWPEAAGAVLDFNLRYMKLRYGPPAPAALAADLAALREALRRLPRHAPGRGTRAEPLSPQ